MFIDLFNNLELMLALIIMMGLIYTAYSITSIYHNVIIFDELFSMKKWLMGFVKLSLLCLSLFLVTIVVSVFPRILNEFNFVILDDEILRNMSMLTMAIIMSSGIYKYFKLTINNLKNIFALSLSDIIKMDTVTVPTTTTTTQVPTTTTTTQVPTTTTTTQVPTTTTTTQYIKLGNEVLTYVNADESKIKNLIKQYNHVKTEYEYIVIHNNGNTKSSAQNDVNWALNNVGTANVSWHYSVDKDEVVRFLAHPKTMGTTCYAGGDGKYGKCNGSGINIEICEYDGFNNRFDTRYVKAYFNATNLVAQLLHDRKWDISRVIQHYDCSGKNCPRVIRKYGFDNFKNDVQLILNELNKR